MIDTSRKLRPRIKSWEIIRKAGDDNSILEDESCHYDGDCEGDDDITNEIHLEVENKEQDTNDGGVHDDEGWITPSNIKYHRLRNNENIPASQCRDGSVLVACITADFAMQNTLRHIGLSVMGVDGKLIWQIRTFILRCYACFKTTSDMAKLFCPNCGNKTLKRVSVTVNPDGTQKIWINYKKPINTRGMIFSLPKPRGGQHARNPILVADQKEVRLFSSKMSKKKVNPLHEDYDP
ncbi:Nin1 binding protein, partial [Halocaridina rubra]